jgi:hypothetical protein
MPDLSFFELIGLGGTGLATTIAVLGLFWKADDAFSEEMREALARRLQRMEIDTSRINWPFTFAQILDSIFDSRLLSWRCFFRSCIASILSVTLLTGVCWSLGLIGEFTEAPSYLSFALLAVCLNLFPDYFSLIETRLLIKRVASNQSMLKVLAFLLIDIVLTTIIFLILGVIFLALLFFGLHFAQTGEIRFGPALGGGIWVMMAAIGTGLRLEQDFFEPFTGGVFFYSTFFTSLWIWLFAFGWLFIINGSRFQKILAALQFALPIKTKPMRAIGEVAALLTALVFIVLGGLGLGVGVADVEAVLTQPPEIRP